METVALGSVVFGLLSALGYGSSDFLGGMVSKKNHASAVVVVSQLFGILSYIILLVISREPLSEFRYLFFGAVGGIFGCFGLNLLYRGLASGKMSIVAPVSAIMTACIPLTFSLITLGLPPFSKVIGILLALVAVWFISRTQQTDTFVWRDLIVPLGAGTCFGITFTLISEASKGSTFWTLAVLRLVSITIMLVLTRLQKQPLHIKRESALLVAICGILDAAGNIFFLLAAQAGRLDIATILSSLYPATTVLLAAIVLKETILRSQWIGIGIALIAIVLITR